MLLSKMRPGNTLRNQILFIFALVMMLVLIVVGILTFNLVSEILKDNAQTQMEQTADQALARIDTQFETIEMITSQVATDRTLQNLLQREMYGVQTTFSERQSMNEIINSYQSYVTGVTSLELYFLDSRRLFPLNELPLSSRMHSQWLEAAQEAGGRLVWAGNDPLDPSSFIAVKQINLIDEDFQRGGYLVTKVNQDYFNLGGALETFEIQNEYTVIMDQNYQEVTGNLPEDTDRPWLFSDEEVPEINGEEYVRVESTSDHTGWTLLIFTPVSSLLEGITGIGAAILIAGAAGLIIFIIASWVVSDYLTKPIHQLTKAMRFGTLGGLRKSKRISSTREITELNDTYNKMVENTNHLIKAVYEKELLKTQAELKALQAQINPHFLFNTLEAIHWTLDEHDEEMAEMIISLSDLFRYTISDVTKDDWVTTCEEMKQVERYMQIMKLRFGERLHWEINLPERLGSCALPKLLIQPVIENALLHGIGEASSGGFVGVKITEADIPSYMKIQVSDNGHGMSEATLHKVRNSMDVQTVPASKGTGLAMRNLYQRIELSYPDSSHAGLYIESNIQTGTEITFILPMKGVQNDA